MSQDTVVLEVTSALPLPGRYEVNPDRVVVEPSRRLLRGRFAVRGGHLVLGVEPELELTLATGSLRTNVAGLARALTGEGGLCAAENPVLTFRSTSMVVADDRSVDVAGRLEVGGSSREVRLSGQITYADELAAVLWLKGAVLPPRRPVRSGSRIARRLAGRRLKLEVAVEFVR
ncbi:hypothetical protein GCM10017786_13950 [Amycolatopsis deserti]|uniref:Lipid/polyisoprenoid-binding YceI-like domain-containing protein n=1 Tax=Amycolatopsis deserti TaxID=185696 RepID=A0ABQ3ILQ1_9PSEU|nr:YceI family protein [Amycolatopsis deserti]GHE83893.1 hypothetical protein GCM10017786_13950 [Amycolatopsis deserti]